MIDNILFGLMSCTPATDFQVRQGMFEIVLILTFSVDVLRLKWWHMIRRERSEPQLSLDSMKARYASKERDKLCRSERVRADGQKSTSDCKVLSLFSSELRSCAARSIKTPYQGLHAHPAWHLLPLRRGSSWQHLLVQTLL